VSDQFVAEIRIFPFNFAPTGWAFCNGQLLPISQNTALFSLLGTTYGGDGKSTFALPNLQGRVPLQPGQGQGLSLYDLGQEGGSETVTLIASAIPSHTHTVNASTNAASVESPTGAVFAAAGDGRPQAYGTTPNVIMNAAAVSMAGGDQPHNNMPPYLTVNFCIALQGIFPPRG
jgi:microcystin-dependent protein